MSQPERSLALVTGASRGIGRAVAIRLARAGYRVAVNYQQNRAAAEDVCATIRDADGDAFPCQFDVADRAGCEAAIKSLAKEVGIIDVLVNNAGIIRDQPLVRMRDEDWDLVIATNLTGVYHCTKAVVKSWAGSKRGSRIITISSISGEMGNAFQTNYSAAKAGLIGFSKALARELAPKQVTVNVVAPGFIETDVTAHLPKESLCAQIPLARFGTTEEVAHVVAMLAAPEAAYITGQVFAVNGGLHM
jgi:3-oxoacyl-[acyl-carrier protein] reductase